MKLLNKNAAFLLLSLMIFFMMSDVVAKNSETIVIKTNIYCAYCPECCQCGREIEKELGFDKGIKLVRVNEKAMTITITFNPQKTTPEKIRLRISKYGYDADDIKADLTAYSKRNECCQRK